MAVFPCLTGAGPGILLGVGFHGIYSLLAPVPYILKREV